MGDASVPQDDISGALDSLMEEMVAQQREKLIGLARRIDPSLVADDLLSPYDFPSIAQDPRFNFEDGMLAGLISARTAIRARILAPRRARDPSLEHDASGRTAAGHDCPPRGGCAE